MEPEENIFGMDFKDALAEVLTLAEDYVRKTEEREIYPFISEETEE